MVSSSLPRHGHYGGSKNYCFNFYRLAVCRERKRPFDPLMQEPQLLYKKLAEV
jgi:hypothetical protein